MTVLIDTDVLVSFINRREPRHGQAVQLVRRIMEGAWGAPAFSDYVLDEALTLLMARAAHPDGVERLLMLAGDPAAPGKPAPLALIRLSDAAFAGAMPLFRRHYRRGLSFTDCTSLALMAERGISVLASFDRGFDGLVARVAA